MDENPPRGNGTVVKLVSVKIKPSATSHIWREFYGKKVWTVNIKDVEYLTVNSVMIPMKLKASDMNLIN